MKDPRITLSALFFYLLIQAPAVQAAVTNAVLTNSVIPYETIGTPTGTTVQFTLDVPGNIELDIHRLENDNDALTTSNLIAAIQQNNVSSGTIQYFWNALWLIGGENARQDGSYK